MKFLTGLVISSLLLGVFVFGLFYYSQVSDGGVNISSPLPEKLTHVRQAFSFSFDFWMPAKTKVAAQTKVPQIQAASALSYDLTTGQVLFDKNSSEKLPMASLTKVMTAIVALDNLKPEDIIEIDKRSASIGENSMGISVGEKLTVEDLMYGLFLMSGNDAAEALAHASPFGRENFVFQMNKKAEELGLSDTRFTNPSGLQGDGKQYSTAMDLLVITKHALENPLIAEVAKTPYHFIPYTESHKGFELYNETNLLTTYPGVKGFKTGYTYEAGLCLITYLEYNGHKVIAVILNSPSRREEMIEILDYSLKSLGVNPPPHG